MIKLHNILPALAAALALTACEEEITNRYVPVAMPEPARSVLIEEYTGVRCVNCPLGHEVLEQIESLYNTAENVERGIEVIPVGIHIAAFGNPVPAGLVAPEAENLTPGSVDPPAARINRTGSVLERDKWAPTIATQIAVQPKLTFAGGLEATISGSTITVTGRISPSETIENPRLHVWILENNIVKTQMLPDGGRDREYVHNNVFRTSATPMSGQRITLNRNHDFDFSITCAVADYWNTANLTAVAFVETEADGALNAAKAAIQQPITNN